MYDVLGTIQTIDRNNWVSSTFYRTDNETRFSKELLSGDLTRIAIDYGLYQFACAIHGDRRRRNRLFRRHFVLHRFGKKIEMLLLHRCPVFGDMLDVKILNTQRNGPEGFRHESVQFTEQ